MANSGMQTKASEGFRSVLVPIDLTAASDRVVARVSLLPLHERARITLLHVVPGALPAQEQGKAEIDAVRALAEEARHLRKRISADVSVEPVVKIGSAATEIARVASELNADMIVMGRGSGRVLRDALLGSTAERVVRQTHRPVLVVRLRARGAYARPLLAVDLDDCAHQIVRILLRVLSQPRPPVEVVHAFDMPYRGMIYPSLSDLEAQERTNELALKAEGAVSKMLAAAVAQESIAAEDVPVWRTHVRHGSARLVVEKAVKSAGTDLLVVGTQGYSGAAYVFLGTVAGDLLRAAKCDVLVVPPTAK